MRERDEATLIERIAPMSATLYALDLRPRAVSEVNERGHKPLPTWVRLIRELDPAHPEPVLIKGPQDVHGLLHERASHELGEVFYVITLNTQARVVGLHEVTRGTLTSSLVHPREVFIRAIGDCAAGIIVAHNHPSGDSRPSGDDDAITRQLVDAGKLLDIPVYDHVIIGNGRYFSFAEGGLLGRGA
jgi:DNA repair protein RadC